MKIIVLFPTVEQAKGFLLSEPSVPIFVSGMGAAETAAAVVRAVKARKPHLVVLAGMAAACDHRLPPGSVVEVTSQYSAALPDGHRPLYRVEPVTDLPEAAGCSSETEELHAGSPDPNDLRPTAVPTNGLQPEGNRKEEDSSGIFPACDTPDSNFHTAGAAADRAVPEKPLIVSREGAALMAVCEALGVRCCEIRVVSHDAGTALSEDDAAHAAEQLTNTLNQLFQKHEQE